MAIFLLDTSTTSLHYRRHAQVRANVRSHLSDTLLVSTETIEEAWTGCMGMFRRARSNRERALASGFLAGVTTNLLVFTIVAPSEAAWDRSDQLIKLKLNVGSADLRIAALALRSTPPSSP